MTGDTRPDPDALLQQLRADEERTSRAKLRIFFGFAPGVGKTYRMLQIARELAAHGADVVAGVVETHGRSETAALVQGLPVLPRRRVAYRGRVLEEFDLESALSRRPGLIVVDELAHSNAEGSRHDKRWQDVLDLLDAGIDVFTTMNVQHVESLNDVVAAITRIQVRETVPDTMLERADEIELVDISPEQLLQRLQEGKVYLRDSASRAAEHFFQRGNLLALRELALRQTAVHVESEVLEYRERHGVDEPWATSERVLVSVGPSPASARLVRAGKRMAAGLRAPWVAASVEATHRPPLRLRDRERLEAHLRLAESLGASVVRLQGPDITSPLLDYARRHNVTRLILGKPTHARILDRLRGSLLDHVVRASGDIDVHVISGDHVTQTNVEPFATPEQRTSPSVRSYALAALLVALSTGVGALIRAVYPVPDVEMLYLLSVMIAASQLGRGPSLLAAVLSVLAFDFFFVPPTLTLAVRDANHILTFAMMFAVGSSLSALTTRLRRQEQAARAREDRSTTLYTLSRSLGALLDPARAAQVVARQAADSFEASATVLMAEADGKLRPLDTFPQPEPHGNAALGATELGAAEWAHEHGRLAGLGTDTLPGSRALCCGLRVGAASVGAIALVPRGPQAFDAEQRDFFHAFCLQAAFAFERARLAEQARRSALHAKTEELRSSLLSAVSHDLRTPLAAITGAATSLRDDPNLSIETQAELLGSVCSEAERLERLVTNLLDMTRLEAGGVEPKREWIPLEEVIGSALTRLDAKLRAREVKTCVAESVPLLSVDAVLMQQVFINLIDNALKYTPEGSPVLIEAQLEKSQVVIEVSDRGPGLGDAPDALFEKFHRGEAAGVSGAGLGLAICRGIVEAHGGSLSGHNREGGGATFRLRLPRASNPPEIARGDA
jgi:two-component system, OmpR family, sensor histidine kinase KdpD